MADSVAGDREPETSSMTRDRMRDHTSAELGVSTLGVRNGLASIVALETVFALLRGVSEEERAERLGVDVPEKPAMISVLGSATCSSVCCAARRGGQ